NPQPMVFDDQWLEMPEIEPFRNSYREGWELFLRHAVEDAPFPAPLIEGAKGVQLAEACHQSDRERRWVDLPPLCLQNLVAATKSCQRARHVNAIGRQCIHPLHSGALRPLSRAGAVRTLCKRPRDPHRWVRGQ